MFNKLYLRIWLAVVLAVAVLILLVGWAWRLAAEPPLRDVEVRNQAGQVIGKGRSRALSGDDVLAPSDATCKASACCTAMSLPPCCRPETRPHLTQPIHRLIQHVPEPIPAETTLPAVAPSLWCACTTGKPCACT